MAMFRGFLMLPKVAVLSRANVAAKSFATLPPEVVIFPDRDTVVCWHPEQEFPYECSRPLPEPEELPYSVFKIQEKEVKATWSKKMSNVQIAEECAKLTYTTKHRWFPRSRDKRAKKTQSDRPYL